MAKDTKLYMAVACWLFNVQAMCWFSSVTDLLKQLYVYHTEKLLIKLATVFRPVTVY